MRRTRRIGRSRALALVLGLALVAGCKDAVSPQEPDVLAGLGPGIHPIVVLASRSGPTAQVEIHLKRIQVDDRVASYQGELEFDTKVLTLSGAEIPSPVMGAWNETAPGKVRFAGAALDGVPDGAVLVLRFTTRGRGSVLAEDFKLRMEELVAATGFKDLSPQLVVREQPLFSGRPLR